MIKVSGQTAKSNVSIPTIGAAHRTVQCSEAGIIGRSGHLTNDHDPAKV
jgi:hypothetical protein